MGLDEWLDWQNVTGQETELELHLFSFHIKLSAAGQGDIISFFNRCPRGFLCQSFSTNYSGTSHRRPDTTSWGYPGRRAKPGCTLGLRENIWWPGRASTESVLTPPHSVYHSNMEQIRTPPASSPKYTLESTDCTPVSIQLETVLIASQEFWKWRAESEVFTTKSPPGLTQLPEKERGSDRWNSCHAFHWVEEREAPTAHVRYSIVPAFLWFSE